eukprot:s347_g23.t1
MGLCHPKAVDTSAMAPKRLADLTSFFSLEKARATLVSDVKLDDALCLWVFLMQNFARPAHHEVNVDLYVTGVQDGAAAVCLAQHISNAVFEAARTDGRSLCKLNFRALASRCPARAAPRHEQDTYAPYREIWLQIRPTTIIMYNDNASGFPQADERQLLFWQDLPKEARCADFVGVIAQFFNFEVVDDQGQISDDLLDFIVPNPNGILAFQSGFNTRVSSKLEETLWQSLSVKVEKAGAKMVFISNSFSFDKSSGKSGTAPPDAIFLQKLLECNQQLWTLGIYGCVKVHDAIASFCNIIPGATCEMPGSRNLADFLWTKWPNGLVVLRCQAWITRQALTRASLKSRAGAARCNQLPQAGSRNLRHHFKRLVFLSMQRAIGLTLKLTLAIRSTSEYIEDFHQNTVETTVDVLIGAGPNPEKRESLLRVRAKKEDFLKSMAFDFPALQRGNGGNVQGQQVRIYVHSVPNCAGEELLDFFTQSDRGFGWDRAVQLHALHIRSVHQAILSSTNRVDSPEEATTFYIPAFFSLLVERYIDSDMKSLDALNCIADSWNRLPREFFLRNAGYDHFIVAGTCFPYSVCPALECDVTAFHPFARNVMALVGGVRDIGHPDFAFTRGAAFQRLSTILVPFPVTLDCDRVVKLADRKRNLVASFVGTDNSRVRSIFRSLIEIFEGEVSENARSKFHIKILEDVGEDGEAARKATLAEDGSRPIDDLYADSEFCLVLPGHVYDLGRRAYDAMARACIPVIVAMDPMFVSVPFAGHIPWEDFAIFAFVRHQGDAVGVLESLFQATQTEEGKAAIRSRRSTMLRYISRLFLPPLANCLPGLPTALDGILTELAGRQGAWSLISTVRPVNLPSPGQIAV